MIRETEWAVLPQSPPCTRMTIAQSTRNLHDHTLHRLALGQYKTIEHIHHFREHVFPEDRMPCHRGTQNLLQRL